jgi:hypothetical protein
MNRSAAKRGQRDHQNDEVARYHLTRTR